MLSSLPYHGSIPPCGPDSEALHIPFLFLLLPKLCDDMNLELLPPDCIASILSRTSAPDACRSAMVCTAVRYAGDSDSVWEKFLPPDYHEILSSLVLPLGFASKKELFFKLCTPRLIEEGRKVIFKSYKHLPTSFKTKI